MARAKNQSAEANFGSDSFLDVVTNIVAILIILTVIVGMRVRNAPSTDPAEAAQEQVDEMRAADALALESWNAQKANIETENSQSQEAFEAEKKARAAELARRAALEAKQKEEQKKLDEAYAERQKQIHEREKILKDYEREASHLEQELLRVEKELSEASAELKERKSRQDEFSFRFARGEKTLKEMEDKTKQDEAVLHVSKERQKKLTEEIAALTKEIEALKKTEKPKKQWVHFATPLSKPIDGEEQHYRCIRGRIADTHFTELIGQIRGDLQSHALNGSPIIKGSTGPRGGFRLLYMLARTPVVSNQLRNPYAGATLQIMGMQLEAESDLIGETKDQALQAGSEFLTSLEYKPPRLYSITLWVYPDSFELARSVRDLLYERGYSVALRPLPFGFPIQASPMGTSSRAQ